MNQIANMTVSTAKAICSLLDVTVQANLSKFDTADSILGQNEELDIPSKLFQPSFL